MTFSFQFPLTQRQNNFYKEREELYILGTGPNFTSLLVQLEYSCFNLVSPPWETNKLI